MTDETVQGFSPRTGEPSGDPVAATTSNQLHQIVESAYTAGALWRDWGAARRAAVLDLLADEMDAQAEELAAVADAETALGLPRLRDEVVRTSRQLRMFAGILGDGTHVDAIVSHADPGAAVPEVRRMLQPMGPVAVFSASNFPFAFSVAGGDTASALAAGCAVVVKAHEAHPQTSVLTGAVVERTLRTAGAPEGLFAVVHGREAGRLLVAHPRIKAVGFTGSREGGRALFDIASGRPEPIPFYGELGSCNPVVALPGAVAERREELANDYVASLTLGTGQFCTNPGLFLVPMDERLLAEITAAVGAQGQGHMLTSGMRDNFSAMTSRWEASERVQLLAEGTVSDGRTGWAVQPRVFVCAAEDIGADPTLLDEVFGPAGLVVTYRSPQELLDTVPRLPGSLAAAVHGTATELELVDTVGRALALRTGRLIYNGWPTGVPVVQAMHHGGPWPATTAPRDTSVGGRAIRRWLVPIAYQNWPGPLLPAELRTDNAWEPPRSTEPIGG